MGARAAGPGLAQGSISEPSSRHAFGAFGVVFSEPGDGPSVALSQDAAVEVHVSPVRVVVPVIPDFARIVARYVDAELPEPSL